ncbi:MAG: NUDIX domain-containing protein [Deltaproteobacteria bacterium]|nr:NUDIX domain-containing protein [Deltaproteobacteria bacterium]
MEQVAAICYRSANNTTEYLLVKTRLGRWTLPKGGVEPGEKGWAAAEREAFEEAGVTGIIVHGPLTTYLHGKKEWEEEGREVLVHAFLLEVKKAQPPEEQLRDPTWFSFDAAKEALTVDRPRKYAEELMRVLRDAEGYINGLKM